MVAIPTDFIIAAAEVVGGTAIISIPFYLLMRRRHNNFLNRSSGMDPKGSQKVQELEAEANRHLMYLKQKYKQYTKEHPSQS